MKNLILISIALFGLFFISCSDGNNEKVVVDPNVSDSKLDNKSGGVYFVSSLAGEYIFRLNLKNGDNSLLCELFHNESYLELAPSNTDWQPGERMVDFEFSRNGIKLFLSIEENGEGSAQIQANGNEFDTFIFKSTSKKPVIIYSGLNRSYSDKSKQDAYSIMEEVMILQNDSYYNGLISSNISLNNRARDNYYFGLNLKLSNKTSNSFSYQVPDSPNAHLNNNTWDRDNVEYDEDSIFWNHEFESDYEYFYDELKLYRRFKQ